MEKCQLEADVTQKEQKKQTHAVSSTQLNNFNIAGNKHILKYTNKKIINTDEQ